MCNCDCEHPDYDEEEGEELYEDNEAISEINHQGYWWMRILYERSTLQVSILTPVYRAYRNQDFWSLNNAN